jgi:hypothetical protein
MITRSEVEYTIGSIVKDHHILARRNGDRILTEVDCSRYSPTTSSPDIGSDGGAISITGRPII